MIAKLVRYRIRADDVETVESAIRDFVTAIAENEPGTHYSTHRSSSGLSYVHYMTFPDAESEERHRRATYTMRFVDVVYPRCDAGPTYTDLTPLANTAG